MNAKRAKKLRKIVSNFPQQPATASGTHQVLFRHGDKLIPIDVTNPITYPTGSQRRLYQDAKREANNIGQ